ncbi:MAG: hypothetical protein WCD21_17970 [Streptomyces sp.]
MSSGAGRPRGSASPEEIRPLLGILGGTGPMATAHIYRRLIERTPAHRDQEHLPVAIWADPTPRTPTSTRCAPTPTHHVNRAIADVKQDGATARHRRGRR